MNPLLQVKVRFLREKNPQHGGGRNLRAKGMTSVAKIDKLIDDLKAVLRFYQDNPRVVEKMMVDIRYNDIIAKSNRVKEILKVEGKTTNDTVVGARFSEAEEGKENHIITHYVDEKTVRTTVEELKIAKDFLLKKLDGIATADNFNEPESGINYEGLELGKSKLRDLIVDCSVIEAFGVPRIPSVPERDNVLITFYKSELSLSELLEKIKVDSGKYRYSTYGDDTLSVNRELFDIINDKIPYMISMISSDWSVITFDEVLPKFAREDYFVPEPQNEPTIGVIDTLFDETVYFGKWVQNNDYLAEFERYSASEGGREHGTAVTSIIVDGPQLNPWLDDHCGRFRVRHFGVCTNRISPARLVRKIKDIVNENPDIHVWNLSLGTEDEISKNFVSFDAAALDDIQAKKNVIFVISGTNDNRREKEGRIRIGSPADSLNSVVVNAVRRDGKPASYSRKGNVLSFYNKPDVAYYGGDYDDKILAYMPYGTEEVCGTSFAAPWISRKLCFLIDVMGMPKELAKALIIDAAASWEYKATSREVKEVQGYGIVPIDIRKILETESDEIRFTLYGSAESYKTANYAIPVPKDEDEKYPYIARATLCYFPECSRAQGVDYTNRELSLKFGRVTDEGKIEDINQNIQDEEGGHSDERQSRKEFRKWDNTKFISRVLRKNKPVKSYAGRLWGISITSKERLGTKLNKPISFGAVVTLKEINGINRIDDFIKACTLRGWIVNPVDVQSRLDIYAASQEEVRLE